MENKNEMHSSCERRYQRPSAELADILLRHGYFMARLLPTGEVAALRSGMFSVGLCVGLDVHCEFRARFGFPDIGSAALALLSWSGEHEPPGPWFKDRHKPR